jgi:hypothetical protein
MASKTFKIGEYCIGGIITVDITKNKVTVINKDWDMSAGSRRSSNQSNAKELSRIEVVVPQGDDVFNNDKQKYQIDDYLNGLTTSYYADQVMKFIKTKINFTTIW